MMQVDASGFPMQTGVETTRNASGSVGGTYASIGVENFGPIAKGQVHLRPLTVFTGRSNTGKSWLAGLVYALMNDRKSYWASALDLHDIIEDDGKAFPENIGTWLNCLKAEMPIELTLSEKKMFSQAIGIIQKNRKDHILQCFGLSQTSELISYGKDSPLRIEMKFPHRERGLKWKYKLEAIPSGEWDCSVRLPERLSLQLNRIPLIFETLNEIRSTKSTYQMLDLLSSICREISFSFDGSAWYLPADRGGIMHAHQLVVSALIRNAVRSGQFQQAPIPPLSGILADFIDNLVMLANERIEQFDYRFRSTSKPIEHCASAMEKDVLAGHVNVEKTTVNYPRFSWTPRGWNNPLALANASSMVTELVPVVLYLRNYVNQDDVLILEEPEAHLHPRLQVQVLRQAAEWARCGIRVILTTHSEWVLEELSNIVGESLRSPRTGLRQGDVGLWRFFEKKGKRGKGSHIEEIKWDIDAGGYETGYMDVARELHNRWEELVDGDIE